SRRRHTRFSRDWSSDVCSSDLPVLARFAASEEPVLVEVPAALERALPERNVVVLGTGEVQERGPETVEVDDTQVDLQTVAEYHARLGRTAAKYLAHFVVVDERCDERRRIGC